LSPPTIDGAVAESERDAVILTKVKRTTNMRVALPVVLERHWKNLWRDKEVWL
jgi:hypothetical protein